MTVATIGTHPIERTLAATARLDEWFAASLGCAGTSVAMLVACPDDLQHLIDQTCAAHATSDRRVGASFLLSRIAWRVIGPLAAAHLTAARIPAIDPGTVRLAFDRHGAPGPPRIDTAAFYALADDPDAAHPDAVPIDDRDALSTAFRTVVASTLAGLLQALTPWARRSTRTQ